jgi:hypothetical protein
MWREILNDSPFLEDVAEYRKGFSQLLLAAFSRRTPVRLTALSKAPKPTKSLFHNQTRMDVTIGHTYNMVHGFKPNNIRAMDISRQYKYDYHYLRQRLAFAPMVANTLGQCGPDLLQFLWNLADHHTRLNLGFSIETTNSLSTQLEQSMDYRKLRGLRQVP